MSITMGWHSIGLTADSPAPAALSQASESRSQAPESRSADSIECVIRRNTTIKDRGAVRAFRTGERTHLPEVLVRAMYAAGSLDCADSAERERRGFTRMVNREGHGQRNTFWGEVNKLLGQVPGTKPVPATGPSSGPKPGNPKPAAPPKAEKGK